MLSDDVHEKMPTSHTVNPAVNPAAIPHPVQGTDTGVAGVIGPDVDTPTDEPRQLTLSDIADETAYPVEAFAFLQRGLAHTVEKLYGNPDEHRGPRHVHGNDLCRGLRDQAIAEFGRLAPLVLARWNIRRTADFGEMVYTMVHFDVLAVSKDDRPEDFHDVFDFAAAFGQ